MNVEVPASPLANKGFKLTKQSLWKSTLRWNAIPANRNPGERFHSNHQGLGIQLAQLGRDASAAVAQVTKEVAWTVLDMHPTLFSLARAYSLLSCISIFRYSYQAPVINLSIEISMLVRREERKW